ncbi:MAG: DUF1579 domain-containing protein [Planctomycetota bacterium]|nr:DUF1579 domain-containing protein [Planctomycetota bacterium]
MKTRWTTCALVMAIALGFFAGVGFSEDPKPDEDAAMKQMMALAKPGPSHKILMAMAGEWDTVMKHWMGPGEPNVTKGSATNTPALNGSFLRQEFSGDWSGMKMHGTGFMGYDNFKKRYEAVWLDNFGSHMNILQGSAGKDGKTITLTYTWDGPMGKIPQRLRYTIPGKDGHKLEGWMTMNGQEVKHMEITYTRKQKKPAGD